MTHPLQCLLMAWQCAPTTIKFCLRSFLDHCKASVRNDVKILLPTRMASLSFASAHQRLLRPMWHPSFVLHAIFSFSWEAFSNKPAYIYWNVFPVSSLGAHLTATNARHGTSILSSLPSDTSRSFQEHSPLSAPCDKPFILGILLELGRFCRRPVFYSSLCCCDKSFTVHDRRSCSPLVAHILILPPASAAPLNFPAPHRHMKLAPVPFEVSPLF